MRVVVLSGETGEEIEGISFYGPRVGSPFFEKIPILGVDQDSSIIFHRGHLSPDFTFATLYVLRDPGDPEEFSLRVTLESSPVSQFSLVSVSSTGGVISVDKTSQVGGLVSPGDVVLLEDLGSRAVCLVSQVDSTSDSSVVFVRVEMSGPLDISAGLISLLNDEGSLDPVTFVYGDVTATCVRIGLDMTDPMDLLRYPDLYDVGPEDRFLVDGTFPPDITGLVPQETGVYRVNAPPPLPIDSGDVVLGITSSGDAVLARVVQVVDHGTYSSVSITGPPVHVLDQIDTLRPPVKYDLRVVIHIPPGVGGTVSGRGLSIRFM